MAAAVHTAARDQYNIFINISSFIPLPKPDEQKLRRKKNLLAKPICTTLYYHIPVQ